MPTKAIPTIYKNTQFRSRLEARWARFFDNVGWRWEYEPIDLDGWIPDFILTGHKADILVEVKPTAQKDGFEFDKMAHAYINADPEVQSMEILLLGRTPLQRDPTHCWAGVPGHLGWLMERIHRDEDPADHFRPALFYPTAYVCPYATSPVVDFCSDTLLYDGRITGDQPGPERGVSYPLIEAMWADAGNTTQWKSPTR